MIGLLLSSVAASAINTAPIKTRSQYVENDGFFADFQSAEMFQNLDYTNPVVSNGQLVGSIRDQSVFGRNGNTESASQCGTFNSANGTIVFDGINDNLRLTGLYPNNTAMTYIVRFRADVGVSGTQTLVGSAVSADRAWLSLTDGVFSTGVGGNGSNNTQDPSGTDLRSATEFHTAGVSWDASNIYMYLDGVLIKTVARLAGTAANSKTIAFGARGLTGDLQDLPFKGEISYVLVSHSVLTEAQHLAVFEGS